MANLVIDLSTISKNSYGNVYKDIQVPLTTVFDVNVNVNAVKQSLANIFGWRRGQRILNPLFGNIMYDYIEEGINEVTLKNLRAAILQMLSIEPRINVIELSLSPDEDQNTIYVTVKYIIPAVNYVTSFSTNITIKSS